MYTKTLNIQLLLVEIKVFFDRFLLQHLIYFNHMFLSNVSNEINIHF